MCESSCSRLHPIQRLSIFKKIFEDMFKDPETSVGFNFIFDGTQVYSGGYLPSHFTILYVNGLSRDMEEVYSERISEGNNGDTFFALILTAPGLVEANYAANLISAHIQTAAAELGIVDPDVLRYELELKEALKLTSLFANQELKNLINERMEKNYYMQGFLYQFPIDSHELVNIDELYEGYSDI
jgi:hypothetical protein